MEPERILVSTSARISHLLTILPSICIAVVDIVPFSGSTEKSHHHGAFPLRPLKGVGLPPLRSFLRALIVFLRAVFCINKKRIIATGQRCTLHSLAPFLGILRA
jgi:hypothetical protein